MVRDRLQGFVTEQVAKPIVDLLEVVDVNEDQAHGCCVLGTAAALAIQHFIEPAPIEQARQGIHTRGAGVMRLCMHALLQTRVVVTHTAGQDTQQVTGKLVRRTYKRPDFVFTDHEQP